MKKFWLIFISICLFATIAFAQSKNERDVSAAVEKLRRAMVSGNEQDLEKIVMDELTYGHSGGHVEGKKEFIDKIITGKSDFVSINLGDQTLKVTKKTAIVRHTLSAETNDNNKPGTVRLKILLIFVKDDGQWKLLARQAVKQA